MHFLSLLDFTRFVFLIFVNSSPQIVFTYSKDNGYFPFFPNPFPSSKFHFKLPSNKGVSSNNKTLAPLFIII